jgi:lysophospholipase L1-like esterase
LPIDPLLLDAFWTSAVMRGESLMFVEGPDGGATASLLFPPAPGLSLTSATGEATYEEGRDYAVDIVEGAVRRLQGSRVPVTTRAELSRLIAAEDDGFHRRQVSATYRHAAGLWTGDVPARAAAALERTGQRLRRSAPLAICLTGDSISEGYNASGFIGAPPYQPAYGELVAAGLERATGSPVTFHNCAVAGWTADHGLADVERVAAASPDLVIVAYGMNDAGYADAADFAATIAALMNEVRVSCPRAEFVLVSPMLPSPGCDFVVMERFPAYRDALAQLCGEGVVLADMTTLWVDLLARKSPYDLTGNGLNHPNDFGHRLYAQMILALLAG